MWCIVCLGAACVRVWGCMWLGNVWLEGKPTKHFFVVLLFAFCFCLLRSIQLFFPNLSTHSLPPLPLPLLPSLHIYVVVVVVVVVVMVY